MDERRIWFERAFEDTKKIVLQAGRRAVRRYPMLREDLDDLIQDTYLELYRKSDQLRAHPNLAGWLVETLNRKAKNRARKRMRELSRRISMDSPSISFEPDDDLRGAIANELGADALSLLEAHYIGGVPIEALANARGTTAAAIKMRFHRWKKRLQKIIPENFE